MSVPDFSDVSKTSDGRASPAPARAPAFSLSTPKMPALSAAKLPPPAFSDIAKSANDLINRDFYHATAAQLEVKLKAPNGTAFTTKGTSPHDGNISANVEAKQLLQNGITATLSWNTANVVNAKAELDGTIAQGLKAEVLSVFAPDKGPKAQKLSLFFKQPMFHMRAFADYAPGGNLQATVDTVVGHEGFLVGGEAGYDVQKAAVTRYSAALGYVAPQYSAALTATNNLSVYSALYYHKVNDAVEAGVKTAYDTKSSTSVGIELASKYKLDTMSFAKAKINDRGIASIAYNTKINKGFTLGLGASFDTQKLNEAGHKIGASFTFEG